MAKIKDLIGKKFGRLTVLEMGVKHTVKRKGLSHQESFDLHLNNYFDIKLQKWIPKGEI